MSFRYFQFTLNIFNKIPFINVYKAIMRRESLSTKRMTSANSPSKDVGMNRSNNPSPAGSGGKSPSRSRVVSPGGAMGSNTVTTRNSSSAPVDMSGELAQFVRDTIKKDEVVIFSKTYCPYCTMAKDPFIKLGKSFTVVELDKRSDGDVIQDILKEMTGARTVPRVFFNGECIGGGTDVKSLYESGTLYNMIVKKD